MHNLSYIYIISFNYIFIKCFFIFHDQIYSVFGEYDMRRIRIPILESDNVVHICKDDNAELYYKIENTLFKAASYDGIINQVQYELCEKELRNIYGR